MAIWNSSGRSSKSGDGAANPPSIRRRTSSWRRAGWFAPGMAERTAAASMPSLGSRLTSALERTWNFPPKRSRLTSGENRIVAPETGVTHSRKWSNQPHFLWTLNKTAPKTGVVRAKRLPELLQKLESFLASTMGILSNPSCCWWSPASDSPLPEQFGPQHDDSLSPHCKPLRSPFLERSGLKPDQWLLGFKPENLLVAGRRLLVACERSVTASGTVTPTVRRSFGESLSNPSGKPSRKPFTREARVTHALRHGGYAESRIGPGGHRRPLSRARNLPGRGIQMA